MRAAIPWKMFCHRVKHHAKKRIPIHVVNNSSNNTLKRLKCLIDENGIRLATKTPSIPRQAPKYYRNEQKMNESDANGTIRQRKMQKVKINRGIKAKLASHKSATMHASNMKSIRRNPMNTTIGEGNWKMTTRFAAIGKRTTANPCKIHQRIASML